MKEMPLLDPTDIPFQRVAFYGPMCVGKTHCAQILFREPYNYAILRFASRLKELCEELYGITSKTGENRRVLQEVGQDLRKHDPDVWIKAALSSINNWEDYGPLKVVIDDLRYTNEAQALRDNGFTLIRVDVPEDVRLTRIALLYPDTTTEMLNHSSEQEWKEIEPDYIVESLDRNLESSLQKILEPKIGSFSE